MISILLKDLNKKQQEAVLTTEGQVLILAGAGSGKTKTLVHRLAYLIQEKKVKPSSILAVTFTNKAAGEMKQRVQKLLKTTFLSSLSMELNQPWVGTFHSFCVRILRKEIGLLGYKTSFLIYNDYDAEVLIKEVMKELAIDQKQFSPRLISNIISQAKNNLLSPEGYQKKAKEFIEKITSKIYHHYQKRLKEINALDFDDLIRLTVKIFQKYPVVLEKYQRRFLYLMIDEYQDTNQAQYLLAHLLAKRLKNICVVGDDWQGIYSFRGADIQNILNFEKDYPETKVIYLEQNYRSTKNIVEASNHIIAKNKARTEKKLWTKEEPGEKIQIQEVRDEKDEGEFILEQIFNQKKERVKKLDELFYEPEEQGILDRVIMAEKGINFPKLKGNIDKQEAQRKIRLGKVNLADFVVLYRTNAQSRALEEVMLDYGIPYQIIGGVKFYERKEIKDILAYLRILITPSDKPSLKRIINEPPRSIGQKSWAFFEQSATKSKKDFITAACQAQNIASLLPKAKEGLKQFGEMILGIKERMKNLTPSEIIDLILKKTGYKNHLLDGADEGESRWENILELKTVAKKFENQKGLTGIQTLLEETALVAEVDFLDETKPGLTLMTAHNAKGLEFPVVFMAGMEEGLFPHANSLFEPDELEEERRLCYVGLTRAKKKVYLIYTTARNIWGSNRITVPSRFLEEIQEELTERN